MRKNITVLFISFSVIYLIGSSAQAQDVYRVTAHGGPPVKVEASERGKSAQPPSPTKQIKGGNTLFNVTYIDVESSTGFGFDDPVEGVTRQATAEAVLLYIADVLNENTGAILDVSFLESFNNGSILAGGSWIIFSDNVPGFENAFALDHITTGIDPLAGTEDLLCTVDFGNPWHSDYTSPPASGEFDLFSVLLHELTHAFGVFSLCGPNGNSIIGSVGNPGEYSGWDRLLRYDTNTVVFNPVTTSLQVPATAFNVDNFSFGGPYAKAAHGSQPPLNLPGTFDGFAHFKSGVVSVMNYPIAAGVARREYSPVDIGALIDIGYTHAKPAGFSRDVVVEQSAGGGFVEEGQRVHLRVAFSGITGAASANWLQNNSIVTSGGAVTTTFQQAGDKFIAELTIDPADSSHEGNYIVRGTDAAKGIFESPALHITVVSPGALPAQNKFTLSIIVTVMLIAGLRILRRV